MLRQICFAVATAALLATPVMGQDDSRVFTGLAVSQAPEAGLGVCIATNPEDGMQCAQQECMELSGLGELDCAVNLWCYPHGWAAQIAVLHTEGIHWSKFLCDEMTREDLEKSIANYCDKEFFAECTPMRIWDPEGTAVLDYE